MRKKGRLLLKKEARQDPEFPRYLLVVNGRSVFYTLHDACVIIESGFGGVTIGNFVLYADFTACPMTTEEKRKLTEEATRYGLKN